MVSAEVDRTSRRARRAVATLFAINGATYNSLVPRFPELRDGLELSNAELGVAIAAFPAAALVVGMAAGPLIARAGSGRVAVAAGALGAVLLPLLAVVPSFALLAVALFALGATDAWTDAAMNAHGLRVQRRYGRSIINALHATWSLAAVGAGFLAAGAAGAGVPLWLHLGVVAAILLAAALATARHLLDGPDPSEADGTAAAGDAAGGLVGVLRSWRTLGPLLGISLLMVCAGGIEDSSASWGAVYLTDDLGTGAFVAGLPFVAFQAAMTLGRLLGDRVVDRAGPVRVARAGALLAALGLGVALLVAHPAAAIVGWAVTGLGMATIFPLGFAAAGAVPGVRPGDGVTVVGWLARLGFLAFPPTIGAVADGRGVASGLALVPVAALGAALAARVLRQRTTPGP